jgi:drug/metabolite transporter (DMT)-like permease
VARRRVLTLFRDAHAPARVAGVLAAAAGVAMMGGPAFAQLAPFSILPGNAVNAPVQSAAADIWDSFNG